MLPKLTIEEIAAVNTLAAELSGSADSGKTTADNMRQILASGVQGIDAAQTVKDLLAGIDKFNGTFEKAKDGDVREIIASLLTESLAGKEPRAQYEALAAILNTLSAESEALKSAQIRAKIKLETDTAITDEMVAAMTAIVAEYLDEFGVLCSDCATTTALLHELGEETTGEIRRIIWTDETVPYFALAMFIMKTRGELPSLPIEMDAEQIGVAAAASVASETVRRDMLIGIINWELAKKLLKTIAAVAITLFVAYVAFHFASFAVAGTLFLTQLILGFGIIGTIVGVGLAFLAVKDIAGFAIEVINRAREGVNNVLEHVVEWRDKVTAWFRETLVPAVVSFWNKLKELARSAAGFVRGKIELFVEKTRVNNEDESEQYDEEKFEYQM